MRVLRCDENGLSIRVPALAVQVGRPRPRRLGVRARRDTAVSGAGGEVDALNRIADRSVLDREEDRARAERRGTREINFFVFRLYATATPTGHNSTHD